MRLNFTDHYMNDYITEFKKDLNKIINDLIEKNIINDFNFNKLSIDYSSKSKQGDISTNLFLILLKQNLKKNYVVIYLSGVKLGLWFFLAFLKSLFTNHFSYFFPTK